MWEQSLINYNRPGLRAGMQLQKLNPLHYPLGATMDQLDFACGRKLSFHAGLKTAIAVPHP